MQLVPRHGLWLPDEMTVLQAAFHALAHEEHPGVPDELYEAEIVENLVLSARDGCHDAPDLVRRCHARMKAKSALKIAFG